MEITYCHLCNGLIYCWCSSEQILSFTKLAKVNGVSLRKYKPKETYGHCAICVQVCEMFTFTDPRLWDGGHALCIISVLF
jgi:hypothetical protein